MSRVFSAAIVAVGSGIVLAAVRGAPIVTVGAVMNRPAMYVQNYCYYNDLAGSDDWITRYSSTYASLLSCSGRLGLERRRLCNPWEIRPAMQAASEQKAIAGMMTAVKPRVQSRALLTAADLEIPMP